MSNRTKKAKTDQLRAATGTKNGQHITRISAGSSRREEGKDPSSKDHSSQSHAPKEQSFSAPAASSKAQSEEITPELIVSETGKAEAQPVDQSDKELNTPKKLSRKERKALKKSQKSDEERPIKSYFLLFRPFVALGRYLRDSWREIRQVRWPNRKATWKMTFAVLVYVALFMVFLSLLDMFFTFIFDLIFK